MAQIPSNNWKSLALDLKEPLPIDESVTVLIGYRSLYPDATDTTVC